jgi:Zn-dependent M28 family amino/carboxypeptidase
MRRLRLLFALPLVVLPACASVQAPAPSATESRIEADRLLTDIHVLAADSMEGRRTGTPGSARARAYLVDQFRGAGLTPFGTSYEQAFTFVGRDSAQHNGVNLVGLIPGTEHPERYLVITAHYDHLGIRDGEIYNGADDNASGTAALLSIAAYLRENRPRHSVIIAAMDAEEMGLQGARSFVASPPIARERILMNINMDMISRNDNDELYAVGSYHYPALVPYVARVASRAPIRLLMGHDRPDLPPGDDWTSASDHGAFHAVGIPFIYFGVEDHPDYHEPTDTVENIQPEFYVRSAETVLDFILEMDGALAGQRPVAPSAASSSNSRRAASLAVLPS